MSTKIYNLDEIKKLSNPVFQQYPMIKEVYLFGSYARKEADEQSDLDFIIVLDSYDTKSKKYAYCSMIDLEDVFSKQVDVISEENAKQIMPKTMNRDKVIIYERINQV